MIKFRKLGYIMVIFLSFSCQQYPGQQNEGNIDPGLEQTVDSLQKEIDSLQIQIRLYQDTIIEQRMRLDKINKILEPLIQ